MGGRGTAGSTMTAAARDYEPYKLGQITTREAGLIYKAVKSGEIKTLPETTTELYGATKSYIRFADERYRSYRMYYDRVYEAARAVLNNDYKKAQKIITAWEKENIKQSGRKSAWYKYKK